MTLENWQANSWLRKHESSPQEVRDLLQIVDRDLEDAQRDLSADWRFGIAYNAALKLCTVLLYATGYRAGKNLQHYRTIRALPLILGEERKNDSDYLDTCRIKRNKTEYDRVQAEYDRVGVVSDGEATELIGFVEELRAIVCLWLETEHQGLLCDVGFPPRT